MLGFNEFAVNKSKKKVVLVVGSPRSPKCCPDEESKTHKIAKMLRRDFSDLVNFETVDLSVKCDGINVLPCKGCVSTSNMHCHWPCDCYGKKDDDLMHKEDVYEKIEACDGFFILTPINWSSCSSVVKSFFDRLVCANLTVTVEEAAEILGEGDTKNSTKTRAAEKSGKYDSMLKNHLEGKVAGFFGHGNGGGEDYLEFAKKKKDSMAEMPESLSEYEKENGEEDVNRLLDPLVRQCVYSGVRVPDGCVRVVTHGYGVSYGEGNDMFDREKKLFNQASETFGRFVKELS